MKPKFLSFKVLLIGCFFPLSFATFGQTHFPVNKVKTCQWNVKTKALDNCITQNSHYQITINREQNLVILKEERGKMVYTIKEEKSNSSFLAVEATGVPYIITVNTNYHFITFTSKNNRLKIKYYVNDETSAN